MNPIRILSQTRAILGECPVWDDRRQSLFWIDIEAGKLFAVTMEGHESAWQLPERIGSFALTTTSDVVVLALETGFAIFNLGTGHIERVAMPGSLEPGVRFNDGKCDRAGHFWAGTMSEQEPRRPDAHLYRLLSDLTVVRMLTGISVSNSLAWSRDGRSFYFADSPTRTVRRFATPASGEALGVSECFASPDRFRGVPDGSETDADDRLWTAEWDGWRILVHDASGRFVRDIDLPVQRPTSCCFGGPSLTTLFVTSASVGLEAADLTRQPDAGRVFAIDMAAQGLSAPRFKGA